LPKSLKASFLPTRLGGRQPWLLTPDDEGSVKGGKPEPRALQNGLLELGYFTERLGRKKFCALKRAEVEIPSVFSEVVGVARDTGDGWKLALGRELEAAGYIIDWNTVMRGSFGIAQSVVPPYRRDMEHICANKVATQ
jgi:hypothetical protein